MKLVETKTPHANNNLVVQRKEVPLVSGQEFTVQ
jgi:hypothetical protein